MKSILTIFALFIGSTAFAGEFKGQGLPRQTLQECEKAKDNIAMRIMNDSYIVTKTECIGTNEDVGGHIPVFTATGNLAAKTEQVISTRFYDSNACLKHLEKAVSNLLPEQILEADCLVGEEYEEMTGKTIKFHQSWISKIVPEQKTAVDPLKIDRELKGARRDTPDFPSMYGLSPGQMINGFRVL